MTISSRSFSIALLMLFFPFFQIEGQKTQADDTIKIGLLMPSEKAPAALHGAELAIRKANEKGSYKGHPFKLVARPMEGPWGTGSREAAELIFTEKVWAIIGSHDGRNAHIVEQVTTKANLVFLSAWAGDPTLSQAFTPWYFSCVPSNLQQADILINEIVVRRKYKAVAIVADNGYDSEQAVKSFILKLQTNGNPPAFQFRYENGKADIKVLADQITENKSDCIIFFGSPIQSVKIITLLKERKLIRPLFGSLSLLDENESGEEGLKNLENVVLLSPQHWFSPEGIVFIDRFKAYYNYAPGAVAAYAYDAVNLIVEAIRTAGLDYEKIQKALMAINYRGVTGQIQFDERGNRKGPYKLVKIKNGNLIPVE
jgi:branched-chain amino acid transport system substrate-binding protein